MVDLEPHHRRLHHKAKVIHIGLIPLALIVPVLWIYFAYGTCQETESPFMLRVCGLLQLIPLLPALLGTIVLGLMVWDLVRIGIQHHEKTHGVKVHAPHWQHAIHGYNVINEHHRRHVRAAAAIVFTVSLSLVAWLILESHHATH